MIAGASALLILVSWGAFAAAVAAASAGGTESQGISDGARSENGAEPRPVLERSVEVGAGYGWYSADLGEANGQFVRLSFARTRRYAWTVDVGRQSRFGESSLGLGLSYTHVFPRDLSLTVGASTGTGDFLAPRYRVGATVSRPIVGIVTSLGYTREQSKKENRYDGIGLGLQRYEGHWIIGASLRLDFGQPGNTTSTTVGAGLTYYIWKKTYIGAGIDYGDVSYMLVGENRALVDFTSRGYTLGFSQWFSSSSGINVRLNYGDTSFYQVRGVMVSLFSGW